MMKTGAILAFSVEAGAILGQADAEARRKLVEYGRALGAAFQVADDILDREASAEALGKRTGKDREKGKATLVDLLGMEGAARIAGSSSKHGSRPRRFRRAGADLARGRALRGRAAGLNRVSASASCGKVDLVFVGPLVRTQRRCASQEKQHRNRPQKWVHFWVRML